MPAFQSTRAISGAVTPTTSDDGALLRVTATATVELTNSGWTVGRSAMGFAVTGAATLTFIDGAGVTVRNLAGDFVADTQYQNCVAVYTGADEWTVYGTEEPQLSDLQVVTAKIADLAVATGKLADGAVTTGKLADGAVTTGKLADGAVTLAKHANVTGPTTLGRVSGTGAPQALTPRDSRRVALLSRSVPRIEAPRVFAALAAASTGCDVLVVGDSIAEGATITADSTLSRRWIQRVIDGLRAAHQPPNVPGGRGYVPAYYDVAAFDGPGSASGFTQSGAVTENAVQGLGRRAAVLASTGALAITLDMATSFDLVVRRDGGARSVAVTIDGGTATVVDCAAAPFAGGGFTQRFTFPDRGRHVVSIAHNADGDAVVEGIMVYDGDESAGIRLWDGTKAGYTANSFASNATWFQSIQAATPDIAIIALGTNDVRTARTPAQFIANIGTIVSTLRSQIVPGGGAVSPNLPIVFVHYTEPNDGTYANWPAYGDELRAFAATDTNATVIDCSEVMAKGEGISGDNLHPTDTGHEMTAAAVVAALVDQAVTARAVPAPARFRQALVLAGQWVQVSPSARLLTNWGNGVANWQCIDIDETWVADRLAVEVTTGGTAGAFVRAVLRRDDGSGTRPGLLVADTGQMDGETIGIREGTISATLSPGRWWVCGIIQGNPGTRPICRTAGSSPIALSLPSLPNLAAVFPAESGVTGAPAVAAPTLSATPSSTAMAVAIRRSA